MTIFDAATIADLKALNTATWPDVQTAIRTRLGYDLTTELAKTTFAIEQLAEGAGYRSSGRDYVPTGETLTGILGPATELGSEAFAQLRQTVTHAIATPDPNGARIGDHLVAAGETYAVVSIGDGDSAAELAILLVERIRA